MIDGSLTAPRRGSNPPDFLVKLLTMVQSEDPSLITWNGGKVFIQDPTALEKKMSAYFRHSNFSSFQRQLNNFGFRKVEGKGKLAPCMYMHDDLQGLPPDSLLRIRRKTPASNPSTPSPMGVTAPWAVPTRPPDSKRRRTDLPPAAADAPRHAPRPNVDALPRQPPYVDDTVAVDRAPPPPSFDDVARELSRDVELQRQKQLRGNDVPRYRGSFAEDAAVIDHDGLDPFATDRGGRRRDPRDALESGLLLSFLENDPASNLPPNTTAMPFFDPTVEASAVSVDNADGGAPFEDDLGGSSPQTSIRANIFGKQHRVLPPLGPTGTTGRGW